MSKKHRSLIFGTVLLITGVVFAYYLSDCQTMSVKKALFPGNQVPDFELKDQDGKNCRLYDFKEKVIVLHFWASWCPPCLEELPAMLNFINNYKNNDTSIKLQWVFIEYDQKWEDAWKVIPNKKYPSQVTLLLDPTNSVAARFGIYKYPETFILSSDFKILHKWVGPQNWLNGNMTVNFQKLLVR